MNIFKEVAIVVALLKKTSIDIEAYIEDLRNGFPEEVWNGIPLIQAICSKCMFFIENFFRDKSLCERLWQK